MTIVPKIEMIELFRYSPPNRIVRTHYGMLKYASFLKKEAARIEQSPGRRTEVREDIVTGFQALFVDDVSGFEGPPPKRAPLAAIKKSTNYIPSKNRKDINAIFARAMAKTPCCKKCKFSRKDEARSLKCGGNEIRFVVDNCAICDNFKE